MPQLHYNPMRLLICIALLGLQAISHAATDPEVCKALSGLASGKNAAPYANPARMPTKPEMAAVERQKLEILAFNDYSQGVYIVDADNDGIDDYFVWNIGGSGRFGNAEIYTPLFKKVWDQSVGHLHAPHFVRYANVNYLVITEGGSNESLSVRHIEKQPSGELITREICQSKISLDSVSHCRHPVCKSLIGTINNPESNQAFREIEWPHMYFPPAGLSTFFLQGSDPAAYPVDFDNTNQPTSIWRFGRAGYIYQHIYWSLLGTGNSQPFVPNSLRNKDESIKNRAVLPDTAHDRLRRLMSQHSDVLTKQIGKPVSLPTAGEFFHLAANNRTYWVWDLGQPPMGDAMHIVYTRGNKTDYIGKVGIKRTVELVPCEEDCIVKDE